MPKRTDIKTILIIGSGPIVIGQGCEFDYSGTQACKALREEGYQVVLVNSNPATIMTDPEFADRTYIEPITPEAVAKIIQREHKGPYHVDALLPTLGGQTALNCACQLYDSGVLDKFGVEMIGATRAVIHRAEDRKVFKEVVESIGLKMPRAGIATSMDEAWKVLDGTPATAGSADGKTPAAPAEVGVGLPAIIRPAFTLGGTGGGIAYNREEYEDIVRRGLDASMTRQVQIDQSVIGWKEYELEVMRDRDDNVVIICSIENFDPMGVHTGDSITVAPAQTLSDKEYQRMRDAAMAIIRAVGVETGGSNIQFAINPAPTPGSAHGGTPGTKPGGIAGTGGEGEMLCIEMNPRVSRSSALASKATGFPIAKIAAKLAVGYRLWELPNDITGKTVACFEPTIDYVVTKIPRWTFEKFPEADETLTTQMKSVGEAMSIGRTFKESLQKGIRSMEIKRYGLGIDGHDKWLNALRATLKWLEKKHPGALSAVRKVGAAGHAEPFRAGSPAPRELCTPLQAAALLYHDPTLLSRLPAPARQQVDLLIQSLGAGHGSVVRPPAKSATAAVSAAEQLLESEWPIAEEKLSRKLSIPSQGRLYYIRYALKMGWSIGQIFDLTRIDPWFLDQIKQLVEFEEVLIGYEKLDELPREVFFRAKQMGYADAQLANLYLGKITPETILRVRRARQRLGIATVYKLVDTCAAEFEAATPYYYSTYESPITTVEGAAAAGAPGNGKLHNSAEQEALLGPRSSAAVSSFDDEVRVSDKPKIVILGGGPNRIGQGIEFDYCCVQAAFAADELGFESVMINSNPETVSTDYDTSDLLFFEPLTLEDVLNICEKLNGAPLGKPGKLAGVVVQYGGQTPLNLAHGLQTAGVPIIGTSVDSIDLTSNRERFSALLKKLNIRQPNNGIAYNVDEALVVANKIGYPVLVRPSFVLGGRAMETVYDNDQLRHYMTIALGASDVPDQPILIDQFLSEAIECDVDVVADFAPIAPGSAGGPTGRPVGPAPAPGDPPAEPGAMGVGANVAADSRALVAGLMEHIEEAGIHSGDSAMAIPPFSLPAKVVEQVKAQSRDLAKALSVRGLMNVQYAIKRPDAKTGRGYEIYVLEVNPRASRTVPFVSKATAVPFAKVAAKVMMGKSLAELGVTVEPAPRHTSVKESVFPFNKFPGVDVILGPEMRSTGEVMGLDASFPVAYAKSQMAAGTLLPTEGQVFISVRDNDKPAIVDTARKLAQMGFVLLTSRGTQEYLAGQGLATQRLNKISEGRPNALDLIKNRQIALIINTPTRKGIKTDEGQLRAMAVRFNIPTVTTTTGAAAAVQAIAALRAGQWGVKALQDYMAEMKRPGPT